MAVIVTNILSNALAAAGSAAGGTAVAASTSGGTAVLGAGIATGNLAAQSLGFAALQGAITAAPATFTAAGSALTSAAAIFGSTGAFLAASALDGLVIGPALFPAKDVEGPRIGDIQFQGASEGDAINRGYGNRVRVPGSVIWATPVEERRDVSKGSAGKGGTSGAFITYKAYRSAAISFLDTEISGLPPEGIVRFVKVFADGKLFWSGDEEGALTNTYNTGLVVTVNPFALAAGQTNMMVLTLDYFPAQPRGLGVYGAGQDIEVSGFTGGFTANNGTFRVFSAFPPQSVGDKSSIWIYDPLDLTKTWGTGTPTGQSITLTQKNTADVLTKVPPEFQLGSADQPTHRLLQERENANVTGLEQDLLGHQGQAIMWLEELLLTDFGNRLPNFEAILEVEPAGSESLATTIRNICKTAGLSDAQIDVSGVTGELRGFHTLGYTSPKQDLQEIMTAHQISVRDTGLKLEFTNRINTPEITLDVNDHDFGVNSQSAQPFKISDAQELGIPAEIDISYAKFDKDLATGMRKARVYSNEGRAAQRVGVRNIALTDDEAQELAQTVLSLTRAHRREFSGTVSMRYLGQLKGGMRINAKNAFGRSWSIFVRRITETPEGLLAFEGIGDDAESFTWLRWQAEAKDLTGNSGLPEGTESESVIVSIPTAQGLILDIPAIHDEHRNQPGFYFAPFSANPRRGCLGFILYESTDGSTYYKIQEMGREAVVGFADTAPADQDQIDPAFIDRATTLRMTLWDSTHHQLASQTESEMLAGHNFWLWGDEIIAVATADLVSAGQYDLSLMMRGLRDTGDEIEGHAVGDRLVNLDAQGIYFIPQSTASINRLKWYKLVAHGSTLDKAEAFTYTYTGRNVTPHRPAQLSAVRESNDDLTITWNRKTRALIQMDQPAPLDEDEETYKLEVYDGATLVRTETVTDTTTYTYTAANQTSDGFTVPSDPVTVRVMQKSRHVHWGRYSEATF